MSIVKNVLKDTFPVFAGYVVLGMGFGIIMISSGFGIWLPIFMSIFIYAGSMQYVAVGLLTGGASMLTVALTTVAVNARHIFYGISMIDKYKGKGAVKPYLIFALTDETYSLVCTEEKSKKYYFLVSLFDQFYWVGGTTLGVLVGKAVSFNTTGVDFALTALFLTVFIDQWMSGKGHFSAVTGVLASVLCLLIFGASDFLIPAMLMIVVVLLCKYFTEAKK